MSELFTPLRLRDVTLRNRVGVAPMCMYSATDGVPNEFHLVHLVSRAVGGAGTVMVEATGVEARGRISPGCLALHDDVQQEAFARITDQMRRYGAVPAIQLAHAGRKASGALPTQEGAYLGVEQGGWEVIGPSSQAFSDDAPVPKEMTLEDIATVTQAFVDAAVRAVEAGFELLEVHAAHGYLLHSFLSPLSNHRADAYGGSFEGRTRFVLEVVEGVRRVVPDRLPLAVRVSATDWHPDGWTGDDTVALASLLKERGVDLVDCSSGGNVTGVHIPVEPGYQVPFAARVRREAGVASAAVGMITTAPQAEAIVAGGEADLVLLARESLRDPYWPLAAAQELGVADRAEVPWQYERGFTVRRGGTPL
jgi:2,4-dienoyl-CoA reductase-like NADH-dependent reductase (Old Yellow Enzyme family)